MRKCPVDSVLHLRQGSAKIWALLLYKGELCFHLFCLLDFDKALVAYVWYFPEDLNHRDIRENPPHRHFTVASCFIALKLKYKDSVQVAHETQFYLVCVCYKVLGVQAAQLRLFGPLTKLGNPSI